MCGLYYTLVKRNEKVAMFGIGGNYTDGIRHLEICKIQIRDDQYGIRESVPQNDLFGREGSRCFANEKLALEYFDKLSAKLCQGMVKVVTGVAENTEVAA